MAVTKLSEIKKYKDGVEVELPGWEDGSLFIAKLRRPSLMMLAAEGEIPNALLGAAAKLFNEGTGKADFKESAELFSLIAKASLVSPSWAGLEEAGVSLTDSQLLYIYNYSQTGVDALRRFREQRESAAAAGRGKAVSGKAQRPAGD